ncbi:cobalamin biosynthesis protein CobW [Lentilitoribacter sp. EG35]|uniref:cobalamin biosynthesis protein CobW n=1 Tax=Lentilitoribacter sp. EG35 TaxID=3234192 RepID=UPI003460FE10
MLQSKIPATIITGFLGAGKTTIIRSMLQNADGKKIALIINEFGDLGVDGDVLKGCGAENCTEEDIVELTNGCICCTVADDFIPTMEKLLEREERPDHIVIETSGLALPQPLVAAFNWPEIKSQVTVDGVVTVVDSAAVSDGRFAHDHDKLDAQRQEDESLDHESPLEELFEDQLTAADMIVLNKADLIDEIKLDQVKASVQNSIERKPAFVVARNGIVPSDVLLGLGVGSEDDLATRKSHHEKHHHDEHSDDDHEHHHHHHDHDEFESFVVELGVVKKPEEFCVGLSELIQEYGILRLKGIVHVPDKAMRLVIQAVGARVDQHFDRLWNADEEKSSKLVVIGLHDIEQQKIASAIKGLI